MSSQPKEIIFEAEARQKLCAGMKKLADVVVCTLGPKGRNVGMEASWGSPTITNDGDRIVQSFELKDTFENMGVSIVKEAVQKIKTTCGDGTTTATLLLATMVELGLKYVAAGASPIELKRGMDKAVEAVLAQLDTMAIPVKGQAGLNQGVQSVLGWFELGVPVVVTPLAGFLLYQQRVLLDEVRITQNDPLASRFVKFYYGRERAGAAMNQAAQPVAPAAQANNAIPDLLQRIADNVQGAVNNLFRRGVAAAPVRNITPRRLEEDPEPEF